MFSSKDHFTIEFFLTTLLRAKIPYSIYNEVVKERVCKKFCDLVVITWLPCVLLVLVELPLR